MITNKESSTREISALKDIQNNRTSCLPRLLYLTPMTLDCQLSVAIFAGGSIKAILPFKTRIPSESACAFVAN